MPPKKKSIKPPPSSSSSPSPSPSSLPLPIRLPLPIPTNTKPKTNIHSHNTQPTSTSCPSDAFDFSSLDGDPFPLPDDLDDLDDHDFSSSFPKPKKSKKKQKGKPKDEILSDETFLNSMENKTKSDYSSSSTSYSNPTESESSPILLLDDNPSLPTSVSFAFATVYESHPVLSTIDLQNVTFFEWILQNRHGDGDCAGGLWRKFAIDWDFMPTNSLPPNTHKPNNLFSYVKALRNSATVGVIRTEIKKARKLLLAHGEIKSHQSILQGIKEKFGYSKIKIKKVKGERGEKKEEGEENKMVDDNEKNDDNSQGNKGKNKRKASALSCPPPHVGGIALSKNTFASLM